MVDASSLIKDTRFVEIYENEILLKNEVTQQTASMYLIFTHSLSNLPLLVIVELTLSPKNPAPPVSQAPLFV